MVSLFGRGFDSLQLHSINQEAAEYQRLLFYFLFFIFLFFIFIQAIHTIFYFTSPQHFQEINNIYTFYIFHSAVHRFERNDNSATLSRSVTKND